jgi:16S rRNA (cytosine1402-N4)-methyltransferase
VAGSCESRTRTSAARRRLIGLDVDPYELPRTEAHLRAAGFGPETFVARHQTFAGLPQALAAEGLTSVNIILADLGVSSMQMDNPDRGFSYKQSDRSTCG